MQLRADGRRYDDTANGVTLIRQIVLSDDRESAVAETTERWYAPQVREENGREVKVDLPPEVLNEYHPQQL